MNRIKVSFQTLHLPPPYAYAYSVTAEFDNDSFNVDFGQEYMNRDTISIEEIENEGFTEEDSFSWTGVLPTLWSSVVQNAIENSTLHAEADESVDTHLFIEANIYDQLQQGHPDDKAAWEYLMQELIQSIYEVSGLEESFKMHLVGPPETGPYQVEASFADRQLKVILKSHTYDLPWSKFKSILASLESLDYKENPKTKAGKKGIWISYDEKEYTEVEDSEKFNELLALLKQT